MTLGAVLRVGREKKGLTLRDVQAVTGRHFTTLSKIENDREKPGRNLIETLINLYGLQEARVWQLSGWCRFCRGTGKGKQ